jgi:hypothetical protein
MASGHGRSSSPVDQIFGVFWEAAQNQPVEQQEQLWQRLYVAPHHMHWAGDVYVMHIAGRRIQQRPWIRCARPLKQ